MQPRTILALLTTKALLAHGHLDVHQDPQVLFCRLAPQQVSPQSGLVCVVIPPQVEDPLFAFVEFQTVHLCPSLQPAEVFLKVCMEIYS